MLFCRGRQRDVPKCKTHVQSDCFCSINLLFCGVVVAVAQTFCASQDGPRNSAFMRTVAQKNRNIFALFMTIRERQNVPRAVGIKKRKNQKTTTKKQKKIIWGNHALFCDNLKTALHIAMHLILSLKSAWLLQSFFLDSNSPYQDPLFPHSHEVCKNTSVLGGTVLE